MKNLAVLVALLGGIAAMPTIDLSNSIAFPNKILQVGNITCTQDEIPIEIDTAADVATHFNQFCHSTKFPASLARGASLMESYEIGIAGKFAFFGVENLWCDDSFEITSEFCSSTFEDITTTCQKDKDLPVGFLGAGISEFTCGRIGFDPSLSKPTSGKAALDSFHGLSKRNASITSCQGCPQCTSPTSSCRPPNWMSCSDEERACLLGNACEYATCLMAGFCLGCS